MPLIRTILFAACLAPLAAGEAPFIDARAVEERWASVSAEDMADLRQRRILYTSKSIGLNLADGLRSLAKQDPRFALTITVFDVEKKGGLPVVPPTAFDQPGIVQLFGSRYPLAKRVEELDALLRRPPWSFGGKIDTVTAIYSAINPETFPAYARLMDGLRADFPRLRIVHATAALNAEGPKRGGNASQHAFSELLRQRYRGVDPVYDLGAILSGDFRAGPVMRPDFTKDPTGVHPNLAVGELTLAKGFILALRDALRWEKGAGAATQPVAGGQAAAEILPPKHPERLAVRAILDRNGLAKAEVDGVVQVRDGHIVGLHLQEAGITELPDEIGELTRLEVLHVYGDRALPHPFLTRISPRIARCTALRELLLNHNDLSTLPPEIVSLTAITTLSLADNRLHDLPAAVQAWAKRHDPLGLPAQQPAR